MAADQGKSSFVRELLARDPEANEQSVNEAWEEAGNEGTISGSLVSKIRSDMGLTGKKGSRDGAVAGGNKTRTPKRATGTRGRKPEQTNGSESEIEPTGGALTATQTGDQGVTGAENQDRTLDELEGDIDELIHKLKNMGGKPEVEEALRRARRLLVRGQQ
jgi:hypothetical protein